MLALTGLGYLARYLQTLTTAKIDEKKLDNESKQLDANRDAQEHNQLTELVALLQEALERETLRADEERKRADREAKARSQYQAETNNVGQQLASFESRLTGIEMTLARMEGQS